MKSPSLANVLIVAANLVGVAAYLYFSVPLWAPEEFANIPGAGAGGPIIWGLTALPVFAISLPLNFVWLASACFVFLRRRSWFIRPIYAIVPLAWVIAVYVDYSHHWTM